MNGLIFHDSHDLEYRSPFGAVPHSQKVLLRLAVNSSEAIEAVILRIWENNNPAQNIAMQLEGSKEEGLPHSQAPVNSYCAEITVSEVGLYWYYFVIVSRNKTYYYGNNQERLGGQGLLQEQVPSPYQITVYRDDFVVPAWFKESVLYQIFVDRFFNGNEDGKVDNAKQGSLLHGCWDDTPCYFKEADGSIQRWNFFGGNLQGIIKKLPYLKELGVGVIYLNPIFEASSNHKYDTADYKKIDPMFGDNADFKLLCAEALKYNIRIMLDGVFSHTGSDSIYFNREGNYPGLGAYQSKKSPYYSWYRFLNHPDEYESWWGVGTLPNVNEMVPSYQEFIYKGEDSVVRYWLNKGAAGWRLDVADELPDEFIKGLRQAMKEVNPEAVLLGEVWEDASNKVSYDANRQYLWGEELDSVTNYPFRQALLDFILGHGDASLLHRRLMSLSENYPRDHFYSTMNLIGSHDVPRVLTLLGEAPLAEELSDREKEKFRLNGRERRLAMMRLKLLVLFQMTFPGVPAIYYGDEAGMEGYADPYNRGPYPWGHADADLLPFYKKAIGLRNNYAAFHKGDWFPVWTKGDVYGFLRSYEDEVFLVMLNRHQTEERQISLELSEQYQGLWKEVFPQEKAGTQGNSILEITLNPLEGKVMKVK